MWESDDPYVLLEHFFQLLRVDGFEKGRYGIRNEAKASDPELYSLLEDIERNPAEASIPGSLAARSAILCFMGCYFSARNIIESSYRYLHAERMIERAVGLIGSASSELHPELIECLCHFARLQHGVCRIDRGIYNSMTSEMVHASARLSDDIRRLSELGAGLQGRARELYTKHLDDQLGCYMSYVLEIQKLADLYRRRWECNGGLQDAIDQAGEEHRLVIDNLLRSKSRILATDLAPHIPVLRQFAQRLENARNDGKLIVMDGHVRVSYFAPVHFSIQQTVHELLESTVHSDNGNGLTLDALAASRVEPDQMSDIWSGLTAKKFIDTYRWTLPGLTLEPFRDTELLYDVELKYYSMGVFSLGLTARMENRSVTALRHAMSLGTPYALDENFVCSTSGRSYGFLAQYARFVFSRIRKELLEKLGVIEGQDGLILHGKPSENRFVSVQIDSLACECGGQLRHVDAAELKRLTGYPAISLPLYEVRSAVDDWIMRAPADPAGNIAPIRYNRDDLLIVNRHSAVVALLQQPGWVRCQAEESVEVAAAMANLFRVTNDMLGQHIRRMSDSSRSHMASYPDTRGVDLVRHREEMQAELVRLDCFERDVRELLDMIHSGSIMAYPDHTRLMAAVFDRMKFRQLHARIKEIAGEARAIHQNTLDEITRTLDEMKNVLSRRMNRILSGAIALISVISVKSFFELFNAAGLGIRISELGQLVVVSVIILILFLVMIIRDSSPDA